jgi:hypothetical protein
MIKNRLPIKQWLKIIASDFTNFNFTTFVKENYHLHLAVCFIVVIFTSYPLLSGIFVTVIAGFREWHYAKSKDAPFSYADLRWTYYGSVLAWIVKSILW